MWIILTVWQFSYYPKAVPAEDASQNTFIWQHIEAINRSFHSFVECQCPTSWGMQTVASRSILRSPHLIKDQFRMTSRSGILRSRWMLRLLRRRGTSLPEEQWVDTSLLVELVGWRRRAAQLCSVTFPWASVCIAQGKIINSRKTSMNRILV